MSRLVFRPTRINWKFVKLSKLEIKYLCSYLLVFYIFYDYDCTQPLSPSMPAFFLVTPQEIQHVGIPYPVTPAVSFVVGAASLASNVRSSAAASAAA